MTWEKKRRTATMAKNRRKKMKTKKIEIKEKNLSKKSIGNSNKVLMLEDRCLCRVGMAVDQLGRRFSRLRISTIRT